MGYRFYPKINRHQTLDSKWRVTIQHNPKSSAIIKFEHIDRLKAKRYEELLRQGKIL